jgi:hypothetical protein
MRWSAGPCAAPAAACTQQRQRRRPPTLGPHPAPTHAGFFSQFGKLTKVRVSRNKKTGNPKHYAFIEFGNKEVARIAAEAMDGYFMFKQQLKCRCAGSGCEGSAVGRTSFCAAAAAAAVWLQSWAAVDVAGLRARACALLRGPAGGLGWAWACRAAAHPSSSTAVLTRQAGSRGLP